MVDSKKSVKSSKYAKYGLTALIGTLSILLLLTLIARFTSYNIPVLTNLIHGDKTTGTSLPTIYYTRSCEACDINWCRAEGEFDSEGLDVEKDYNVSELNLQQYVQQNGCESVTSAWGAVRNTSTARVYAVPSLVTPT